MITIIFDFKGQRSNKTTAPVLQKLTNQQHV